MAPSRYRLLLAAICAGASPGHAAPELAPLFRDHAVLQSGKPVSVWGRALAGEHVVVSYSGQSVGATAGLDGRWMVVLAPMGPNGVGTDLIAAGRGVATARDVVTGEVWLCAGGAGIDLPLGPVEVQAAGDAGAAVRQFKVGLQASATPQEGVQGGWVPFSRASAARFSAVGFHFAREIVARLSVPVGIIECSCGGAPIESWMSPQALSAAAPAPGRAVAGTQTGSRGGSAVFNGMIHPLLPCAIRGVVWYQGEADVGRAAEYALLFPAMITAWRSHFGQGDVPFLWVQLGCARAPGKGGAGEWAPLREAQSLALALPSTGQAVAIDLGEAAGMRPADAREIARRLALIAKANAYSIEDDYSGPVFSGLEASGSAARVHFRFAGDGLTASGRPLQSFEVAGSDRVFHPASAVIEADTVVVRSPAVRQPVAVRYAWTDAPYANLYNGAGLPAAPFRSDAW